MRGWFGRRAVRRRREDTVRRRREAMEAVWYVTVLGAMEKSIARFEKVHTLKKGASPPKKGTYTNRYLH